GAGALACAPSIMTRITGPIASIVDSSRSMLCPSGSASISGSCARLQGASRLLSALIQVALPQDRGVMADMAGGNVGQRSHRHRVVARDAAAHPRLGRKAAKERDRRRTDREELFHVTVPVALVGSGSSRRDVLIEAGKRAVEAACEPERAEHEQP